MVAGNLSLSEKYRPRMFRDFIGKADAVGYLSTQVQESRGRSVLLHGPSGCGKSSLGEVYAAGLLCTAATERPCRLESCPSCSALRYGTHLNLMRFEYGRVADEEFADRINTDVRAETFGNGHFVVLIDRAELLSARAFDILHDQMKRPFERVTFILCAIDASAISRETSALFYPLAIKPPGFLDATEYVKRIGGMEGIALDAESVELLADLGRSSFGELALTLEVLAGEGQITASAILDHYVSGEAAAYVDLVVKGHSFEEQLSTLERWQCAESEKVRRTGAYLSRVFDVRHGVNFASLHQLEHKAKFSDAITRHSEILRQRPRAFARRMLQIWDPEPFAGPTTLRRKASEFDALFRSAAPDVENPDATIAGWRAVDRRTRDYRAVEARELKASASSQAETTIEETSLTLDEAKKLWHGASFMAQVYGALLNTRVEIRHGCFVPKSAKRPEQVVTDFLRELRIFVNRVKVDANAELHTLYVHRTDQNGDLVTTIFAHLPSCKRNVSGWIRAFFCRRASAASVHEAVSVDALDESEPFERHLNLIRSACSGLMPIKPEHQVFLRRTRIPARQCRPLGPKCTAQRVGLSRWIDSEAQGLASGDLEPLYVLEDPTADACSGWEMKEFAYRKRIVEEHLSLEAAARDRIDAEVALAAVTVQWRNSRALREVSRPGFS
jgi:DNA polymerase-3 subunit gamma/tau